MGITEDKVIVPQARLDKLEKARLALWTLVDNNPRFMPSDILDIAEVMWCLTHGTFPQHVEGKSFNDGLEAAAAIVRSHDGDDPPSSYMDDEILDLMEKG